MTDQIETFDISEKKKPKTPEEVAKQAELDSLTFDIPSEEDSGGSKFLPLKEDIYLVTVEAAEVRERPNFNDPTKQEKVIMVTFNIDGTLSGEPIKDIEGTVQEPDVRKFWEWLSVTSLGFKGDGTPSKTRACLCALNGVEPSAPIVGVTIPGLIGKSCKVFLEVVSKKDGDKKNKAMKYSKL